MSPRDGAQQRDQRRTRSDADVPIRLAPYRQQPLIAPRHSEDLSGRAYPEGSLPPLADTGLLREGRGVYVQPAPVPSPQTPERGFYVNGRKVDEYQIKDSDGKKGCFRPFIMAMPRENENHAKFTLVNAAGRTITYVLDVAQPPKQARACGNGPRSSADRRPIDPPPVIKLSVFDGNTDITGYYESNFMLYASLEFARPIAAKDIWTANHCPVLTGTNCAGAAYLTKPSNAIYFIFPDLSVRHEGFYRLKFHLFEQNKPQPLAITSGASAQAGQSHSPTRESESMVNRTFVYSAPFQVFSAKKFPGLENSTQLSMLMSEQGCRVRIRREVRQRRDHKNAHKDDDQRSLRAASRDRVGSVDTQDHHSRSQYTSDTRRPSIDSQYSQVRPSQHIESALTSPLTSVPPSQYGRHMTGEPQNMWSAGYRNTNMPPAHSLPSPHTIAGPMPPPVSRVSYPPISPATPAPDSSRLSISSLTQTSIDSILQPAELPRPVGGLYETEPVNKKRALNRSSEERSAGLKDHARPSTDAPSSYPKVYGGFANTASHAPLASVNTVIEADPNEESTDDPESDFEDASSYRRANGSRNYMNRMFRH